MAGPQDPRTYVQRGATVGDPPAGFGFAYSITPPTPLVDTEGAFAVPPEALLDWAAEAEEGARCVYARVETMARHPRLRDKVSALVATGVLTMVGASRHRTDSSLFDHIAKRTSFASLSPEGGTGRPSPAPLPRRESAPDGPDPALETIYAELQRAARAGRRCPSDFDLARKAELPTRNAAAWRVRKLAQAERIGVETLAGPDGCAWRVVVIGGKRTALPPLKAGKA